MSGNAAAIVAILGMALVTYLTRVGGFWFTGRVRPSRRVKAGLRQTPGAVLVTIVVPAVIEAGLAGAVALLATVLVARRTHNLLFAAITGVGIVAILRYLT